MKITIGRRLKADLILIFCTVIWGGTFVVLKYSLESVSPLFYVSIRFFLASLLVFPFIVLSPRLRKQTFRNPVMAWNGLFLAVFMFIGFGFQTIGLIYTTASRSAFITELLVIITPLLQYVLYRKKPSIGNYAGMFLIIPGMYFLTAPDASGINPGDILTLICAFGFALYIVYLDHFSRKHVVIPLLFWQMSGASVFALAGALLTEEIKFELNFSVTISLFYLSFVASILALYLQTRFQKETTPIQAGILYSMEPVFATLFAVILLGENHTAGFYGGGILILTGVLVSGAVSDETDWYKRFH